MHLTYDSGNVNIACAQQLIPLLWPFKFRLDHRSLQSPNRKKRTKTMHSLTLLLVALTLAVAYTSAVNNGAVTILVDGRPQTKYVLSGDWAKGYTQVNGSSITLHGGGRIYTSAIQALELFLSTRTTRCLSLAKDSPSTLT